MMKKKVDIESMQVIIETPRGSRNKYKYDELKKIFELKKILPTGAVFPFDFGFIPGTKGEDGDPVDMMVLMDVPVFPGCIVHSRVIGVLEVEQKEKKKKKVRNDRIIGVEINSGMFANVKKLKDLDKRVLKEIIGFFMYCAEMEGKKINLLNKGDAYKAKELIESSLE
jgi:inorganic pyrophosphatase